MPPAAGVNGNHRWVRETPARPAVPAGAVFHFGAGRLSRSRTVAAISLTWVDEIRSIPWGLPPDRVSAGAVAGIRLKLGLSWVKPIHAAGQMPIAMSDAGVRKIRWLTIDSMCYTQCCIKKMAKGHQNLADIGSAIA